MVAMLVGMTSNQDQIVCSRCHYIRPTSTRSYFLIQRAFKSINMEARMLYAPQEVGGNALILEGLWMVHSFMAGGVIRAKNVTMEVKSVILTSWDLWGDM